ncbi:hypothetical protein Tfer_0535 [Thermincola ferriacetica]|uniref:DUF2802 domain-containing protein n=1 Tax=Thermincola ferriacetica TaxID=281456 RepID=A0A0L6W5Q0_9FIRM|nr:hypothetical protein [Thermincola ferriacetica]KNZ70855.1 hypothetical protein Tfer_0535 [Thermincola ferriacetica]
MSDLLLLIGLILVIGSFWSRRRFNEQEIKDLQKIKAEIVQAKEDVGSLMKELIGVSEQVVETISEKIKEAQVTVQNMPVINPDQCTRAEEENKTGKIISLYETRSKEKERDIKLQLAKKEVVQKPAVTKDSSSEYPQEKLPQAVPAKHQAVYSLAEMGYTVDQIAKQMSIGKGEVALILELKNKGEEINGI